MNSRLFRFPGRTVTHSFSLMRHDFFQKTLQRTYRYSLPFCSTITNYLLKDVIEEGNLVEVVDLIQNRVMADHQSSFSHISLFYFVFKNGGAQCNFLQRTAAGSAHGFWCLHHESIITGLITVTKMIKEVIWVTASLICILMLLKQNSLN